MKIYSLHLSSDEARMVEDEKGAYVCAIDVARRDEHVGPFLSAALDDPTTSDALKQAIRAWLGESLQAGALYGWQRTAHLARELAAASEEVRRLRRAMAGQVAP